MLAFRVVTRALPILAIVLAACAPEVPPVTPTPAPSPDPRAAAMEHLYVLMLNGGGQPEVNFQTHLMHLKELRQVLLGAGVAPDHLTILSGDGADPAPDLAARAPDDPGDLYLVRGTRQEKAFETQRTLLNSEIPGATLGTAGKAEIAAYFDKARATLKPGDTLLLYVTDHGRRNPTDITNNTILLWKNDKLAVRDLGAMLDGLDPGVRVVGLMSQCFSGSFAGLATRGEGDGKPRAPFCGYFAAPADRPAYGCYPEDRSRDRAGYSFQVLHALDTSRSLAEAHLATLLRDEEPDAPLRTTDTWLDAALHKEADRRKVPFEALVDELLAAGAPGDPTWAEDRALAERIAATYGVGDVRSFSALWGRRKELPELSHALDSWARVWRHASIDLARVNVGGFLATNPSWNDRAGDAALKALDPAAARTLTGPFLKDLAAYTPPPIKERLASYRDRVTAADAASYRAEVRLAASLRVRTLLTTLAGRAWLAAAPAADRAAWEALRACENLRLPGAATPLDPPPTPLPPLAEDEAVEARTHPSWLGLESRDLPADLRRDRGFPEGAVAVTRVYDSSPASAAGLQVGDVVLSEAGKPFAGLGDARMWSLTAPPGTSVAVEVERGSRRLGFTLTPVAQSSHILPLEPLPTVGDPLPKLDVRPYRGDAVRFDDGKPHLLMFWATWCIPCKNSLPEVLAFEKQRKVEVLAVTDDDTDVVDAFFKKWKKPFPAHVATDPSHHAFDAFGIKGRPVFLLVDEKGRIVSRSLGYDDKRGIGVPGWKWKR